MAITLNPMLVTFATNTFSVVSDGYVQGTMMDSPSHRYDLSQGILAASETLPIFGGVALYELIPSDPTTLPMTTPWSSLGNIVQRATSSAQIIAFSVFNQAHHWITSPQNTVPCGAAGMSVPYFRAGSGVQIALKCDPSLAATLVGGSVDPATTTVSWDFSNQQLAPYSATATQAVTSLTWSATNGGQVAVVMAAASIVGAVGDEFTIAGATNTGTGGTAAINTMHVANTWTNNQNFTFLLPGTAAQWGTLGGTITLTTGSGDLSTAVPSLKILGVNIGNSKVVDYSSFTGFATWRDNGTCALVQL